MSTPPGEIPEKGRLPAEMTGVAIAGAVVAKARTTASAGKRPGARDRDGERSLGDMRVLSVVNDWSI
jgi:hypothetical protein